MTDEQRCPTCGARVRVAGDEVEGTMHYEPLEVGNARHPEGHFAGAAVKGYVEAAVSTLETVEGRQMAADILELLDGVGPS